MDKRLPELPFITFADNGKLPAAHRDRLMRSLPGKAGGVRPPVCSPSHPSVRFEENIKRLDHPETVAVAANIAPDLFGGALSQFLKCVAVLKTCEALAGISIPAVPVCGIGAHTHQDEAGGDVIRVLDSGSELHRFSMPGGEPCFFANGFSHSVNTVSELIEGIEQIGRDRFDPGIMDVLKSAYNAETGHVSACAKLIAELTNRWGMLVVDASTPGSQPAAEKDGIPRPDGFGDRPAFRELCAAFPVLAWVLAPGEFEPWIEAQRDFDARGLVPPLVQPFWGATIFDAASRRILNRYGLGLRELYAGEEAVLSRTESRLLHGSGAAKLESLRMEVEGRLNALSGLASEDGSFRKARESCRERIVYQINKMKRQFETADSRKRQVMHRHIRRVCNFLAPDGARQDRGLAGIYFLLRYSFPLLSFLYENMDLTKPEHQSMDIN